MLDYYIYKASWKALLIHGCKNYRHCFLIELKIIESVYIQDY